MVSESAPRIAIDARLVGAQNTGDSTYWLGLLTGLSRINTNFRFLLFSNAPRPSQIPKSDNFEWIRIPAKSSRWWSFIKFPAAARRMGASAIHTQYSLPPSVGKIGITTIHDVSFFIGPEWFKAKDRNLLRLTVPAAARRAARIITVSETSKADIAKYIPGVADKTRVTYLAPHPAIVPQKKISARQRVKQSLGIDEPFVLTVGTRWPRKNMQLAIDAMQLLPSSLPHKLLITGKEGWGENRQSAIGNRQSFTGYVDFANLSALYCAADLYLAPSRHEGFGIPLLEAFECGCPVLGSSGGALPEVAGGAAEIEPTWDPAHWSKTIEGLLSDSGKLDQLQVRGLERAKQFTWQETARKTLEVYKEVVG